MLGLPFWEAIDIWSLGCIAAELLIGCFLYPGASEYEQILYITETQGMPDDYMLNHGMKTEMFFTKGPYSEYPDWRLKTPGEYAAETGKVPMERREYIFYGLDGIAGVNLPSDLDENGMVFEKADRRAFMDLVKEMLSINPLNRISPEETLYHPFLTMVHRSELLQSKRNIQVCKCSSSCSATSPPASKLTKLDIPSTRTTQGLIIKVISGTESDGDEGKYAFSEVAAYECISSCQLAATPPQQNIKLSMSPLFQAAQGISSGPCRWSELASSTTHTTESQHQQQEGIPATSHFNIIGGKDEEKEDDDGEFNIKDEEKCVTTWCTCGKCHWTSTKLTKVGMCCRTYKPMRQKTAEVGGVQCISCLPGFRSNCLDQEVLETTLNEFIYTNGPIDESIPKNKVLCIMAYRRFIFWIWKILDKSSNGIPPCVVHAIETKFLPQTPNYDKQHPPAKCEQI